MFSKVYLSGPIAGLTFNEATIWRHFVTAELEDWVEILDPMRGCVPVEDGDTAMAMSVSFVDEALSTDRGIMTRDYNDTKNSDLIFINLLGAKKASVGTAMELAWAYDMQIPVIVVMETEGNPHEHPMMREAMSYRVDTLERGVAIAKSVLAIPEEPVWGQA